jgi:hypothetical protein
MRPRWGPPTFRPVYPRLATPKSPRRPGPDGLGRASARPGPARLWLVVALCLLPASAAPPAAGAEQASPTLGFDRQSAEVGQHVHLTVTAQALSADSLVRYSLPQGLRLLSANPSNASLGTWPVPAGSAQTLDLRVEVTAAGAQTATASLEGGPQASATIQATPNPAPVISRLSMKSSRFRFSLSEPATLSIAIQHTADRHTRFVERRLGGGAHSLRVTLAPGGYRATFIPTDALGKQGRARHVSFAV